MSLRAAEADSLYVRPALGLVDPEQDVAIGAAASEVRVLKLVERGEIQKVDMVVVANHHVREGGGQLYA